MQSQPRTLKQLRAHVKELRVRGPRGDGFDAEFLAIEKQSESDYFFEDFTSARRPYNRSKNRYSNVLPLEKTRVVLPMEGDTPGSDYINANFVNGDPEVPGTEKLYIAAQGPLDETVVQFWRMIWYQNCNVIVMLTRIMENSKEKCHQYWPLRGVQKIGKLFKVMNFGDPVFSSDVLHVTKLQVENLAEKCSREVYHFQYKEWPDHGLPKNTETFRHLLDIVEEHYDRKGPILVHCSAGIGRTGTFCTVHSNLMKLKLCKGDKEAVTFDVFGTVLRLRKERVGMVQTKEQYMFCYLGILEGILKVMDSEKVDEIDQDHEFRGSTQQSMEATIAALKASEQEDKKKTKKPKKSSLFKRKDKKK